MSAPVGDAVGRALGSMLASTLGSPPGGTWQQYAALAGVLLMGAAAVVTFAEQIVRQRRAEAALVRRLLQDEAFVAGLLDYLEADDRDGPAESRRVADALRPLIEAQVRALGPEQRVVRAALQQSSARGRVRYVEKLAQQAAAGYQLVGP